MKNQEYKIELLDVARLLIYNWKRIAACIIICAVVAYIYTDNQTTQYEADISFAVGTTVESNSSSAASINGTSDSLFGSEMTIDQEVSKEESFLTSAFADSEKLANYCGAIMKSDTVLKPIIDKLELNIVPSELSGSIYTTGSEGIPLLQVTVIRPNADEALQISRAIAELAPAIVADVTKINDVTAISIPTGSRAITKPITKNTMLGAAGGLVLSIFVLLTCYLANTLVRKEEDITNVLGVKALGVIPAAEEGEKNVQ